MPLPVTAPWATSQLPNPWQNPNISAQDKLAEMRNFMATLWGLPLNSSANSKNATGSATPSVSAAPMGLSSQMQAMGGNAAATPSAPFSGRGPPLSGANNVPLGQLGQTWQSQNTTTNNVYDAPPDFYTGLLPSWNTPPQEANAKEYVEYGKFLSLGLLIKFNGDWRRYNKWRTELIAYIHNVRMDFRNKVMAMGASLDTSDDRMRVYHDGLTPDQEGYSRLIRVLEDRYGGQDRMVENAAREMRSVKMVDKNSAADLENFLQKLHSYRDVCRSAGLASKMDSKSFAITLTEKLDAKTTNQYVRHLERCRLPKKPSTLLEWAEGELAYRIRREEEESRKGGAKKKDAKKEKDA